MKEHVRKHLAWLVFYMVLPFILASIPVELLKSLPSICLYKNIFGRECYGCGITRAFFAVLHGDFRQAFMYNPLIMFVFPVAVFLYLKGLCKNFRTGINITGRKAGVKEEV